MTETEKTTIQVSPQTRKRIKKLAAEFDCNYGVVVEKMLDMYEEKL